MIYTLHAVSFSERERGARGLEWILNVRKEKSCHFSKFCKNLSLLETGGGSKIPSVVPVLPETLCPVNAIGQ